MDSIEIRGQIDDEHRLTAVVPGFVPPGPVTIWISTSTQEDDAGVAWMTGIAAQWAEELNDARQDIYTLGDGESIDPA